MTDLSKTKAAKGTPLKRAIYVRIAVGAVIAAVLSGCTPTQPPDGSQQPSTNTSADAQTNVPPGAINAALADTRPTSYVQTYTVDPARARNEAGIYPTLAAATAAARNDIKAEGSGVTADLARSTPTRRRLITVAPGIYHEMVTAQSHVDIRGLGAHPSDTTFTSSGTSTGATLNTSGASTHISNVRIVDTSTVDTRHAMRDAGTGGDQDKLLNRTRRTVVLEDVELVSSTKSGAKGGALDMTPGQGAVMLFNRVTFESVGQPQAINAVLGRGTKADPGSTVIFANCTVVANKSAPSSSVDGHSAVAHPVGLTDFGGGSTDMFFWYGGKFDVNGIGPAAADVTANYEAISGNTPGVQWFIDPSVSVKNQTGGEKVHSVDDHRPDIPIKGVSQEEKDAYEPDMDDNPSTRGPLSPEAKPTEMSHVTPGRIYYIKVKIAEAMRPVAVQVPIGSDSGKIAAAYYLDQSGAPATGANLREATGLVAARSGNQLIPLTARRRIWPGDGYVWVAFAAADTRTTVGVLPDAAAAGLTVKYQDGWNGVSPLGVPGGLADLPAGEPSPVPALIPFSD